MHARVSLPITRDPATEIGLLNAFGSVKLTARHLNPISRLSCDQARTKSWHLSFLPTDPITILEL